jgi:DNA-binding NarL/FixJ family response regulator
MKKTNPQHPGEAGRPEPRRILIVDDHPLVRDGLVQILQKEADLTVCGEAGDAAEALEQLAQTHPNVVLVDLSLPGRGGIELVKDIAAKHPDLPILVLSIHEEDVFAERALRAGAKGYIEKHEPTDKIINAIRTVLSGQLCVSPNIVSRLVRKALNGHPNDNNQHTGVESLSDREIEVFEAIGHGRTSSEIAKLLHLSVKTIDMHIGHIKRKLEVDGRGQLMRYAIHWVDGESGSPSSSARSDST